MKHTGTVLVLGLVLLLLLPTASASSQSFALGTGEMFDDRIEGATQPGAYTLKVSVNITGDGWIRVIVLSESELERFAANESYTPLHESSTSSDLELTLNLQQGVWHILLINDESEEVSVRYEASVTVTASLVPLLVGGLAVAAVAIMLILVLRKRKGEGQR